MTIQKCLSVIKYNSVEEKHERHNDQLRDSFQRMLLV